MYITKMHRAGDYVLIQNYSPRGFGAPGRKREKRMRDTPKAMAKYNNHKRADKLQLLIISNFDKGYHLTLDYQKGSRPETYEEAETILRKFLYKMSRRQKKQNKKFKYIAITERGRKQAALHHHMIIESDPYLLKDITEVWGNHIKVSQMYEEGAYKDLAEYFCKIETKEEQTKGKSKYHRSRNLIEPQVKTAFMAGGIKDEPNIPKGYEVIPDSLVNGFNDIVGIKYQRYMLKKSTPRGCIHKQDTRGHSPSDAKGNKKCHIWESIKKLFRKGGHE